MQKSIRTLSMLESEKLLEYFAGPLVPASEGRRKIRDSLMAMLMLDAGLRVGETVQLLRIDLWFHDGPVESLLIRPEIAKRARERIIPLSQRIRRSLICLEDACWRLPGLENCPYAFVRDAHGHQISVRQVERIIARASLSALGFKIHPHSLRHTFASRLMRQVNSSIVQELLGHKHLSSTQIYCHPSTDDLRKAIDSIGVFDTTSPVSFPVKCSG